MTILSTQSGLLDRRPRPFESLSNTREPARLCDIRFAQPIDLLLASLALLCVCSILSAPEPRQSHFVLFYSEHIVHSVIHSVIIANITRTITL